MLGIYFSGTGNTKYCVESFLSYFDSSTCISIENPLVKEKILESNNIVLGYPIYYSNLPKIVRDFLESLSTELKDKNVYIICTMGLFSGDGTGVSARLLKKKGSRVIGGLHIKMPDCIGDVSLLKKPLEKNKDLIIEANVKIQKAAYLYKNNQPTKDGLSIIDHLAGLFGQRLWFFNKTRKYSDKITINKDLCKGCSKCVNICPMNNLKLLNGKAISSNRCTLCYRCINNCDSKAITLLGKKVIEQSLIEKYLN